jgi:hypothetical protein
MGFFDWFHRRRQRARIVLDDLGVTQHWPEGVVETISWSDLREVRVYTTDKGPWAEDVFFSLLGPDDASVVVPQEAEGSQALVERLIKLPGFDERLFIEAMGSTSNREFICWRRAA